MFSRPLAFLLLALGCITAAAGSAYIATRQNASEAVAMTSSVQPTAGVPAPAAASTEAGSRPPSQPVAETEAAVSGAKSDPAAVQKAEKPDPTAAPIPRRPEASVRKPAPTAPQPPRRAQEPPAVARTVPMNGAGQPQPEPQTPAQPPLEATPVSNGSPKPAVDSAKPLDPQPEPPRVTQFEELILPASSVIGLQLETSISSERARVEDRVEARVSRDVMAAGRLAIPVGARVIGSVIEVEKGGKMKTAARIGIRFHTLVLADGSEVSLRTESIYREGESPAANSAKKIGGGALAGMILGGILGGGKGAAAGGATGAAGGTASVMTGDRATVNIPSGSFVTAKLSSPATITVERRE